MCLVSKPLVARGIGEEIEPISLPALPLLLVNPLKPVSTPAIFRLLVNKTNPPMPPVSLDSLGIMRNDLQPAAERLEPSITHVLRSLGKFAPLVARMSGSGATCFGIFQDKQCLDVATEAIRANRPDWYVQDCMTLE